MSARDQIVERLNHCNASLRLSAHHMSQCDGRILGAAWEMIRTLNTNVDVILRLLGFSCVLVGFGEGVYEQRVSLEQCVMTETRGIVELIGVAEHRQLQGRLPPPDTGRNDANRRGEIESRERTVGLEIFDGHKLGGTGVTLGNGFCMKKGRVFLATAC